MSRQQFGFLAGVLLVWMAWSTGWVVVAGVAAGLVGLGIVRVLSGQLDLNELGGRLGDRLRSGTSSHPS